MTDNPIHHPDLGRLLRDHATTVRVDVSAPPDAIVESCRRRSVRRVRRGAVALGTSVVVAVATLAGVAAGSSTTLPVATRAASEIEPATAGALPEFDPDAASGLPRLTLDVPPGHVLMDRTERHLVTGPTELPENYVDDAPTLVAAEMVDGEPLRFLVVSVQHELPPGTPNYPVIAPDDIGRLVPDQFGDPNVFGWRLSPTQIATVRRHDVDTATVERWMSTLHRAPDGGWQLGELSGADTGGLVRVDIPTSAEVHERRLSWFRIEESGEGGCDLQDGLTLRVRSRGADEFWRTVVSTTAESAPAVRLVPIQGRSTPAYGVELWGESWIVVDDTLLVMSADRETAPGESTTVPFDLRRVRVADDAAWEEIVSAPAAAPPACEAGGPVPDPYLVDRTDPDNPRPVR